jgi:hypothetical protein
MYQQGLKRKSFEISKMLMFFKIYSKTKARRIQEFIIHKHGKHKIQFEGTNTEQEYRKHELYTLPTF